MKCQNMSKAIFIQKILRNDVKIFNYVLNTIHYYKIISFLFLIKRDS